MDLAPLTAHELADLLASREVSAVEAAQACIDRIAAADGELNAFVTVTADAVAKCYDLLIVTVCKLDLNLRQVGGRSAQSPQAKKVRAFISANYDNIIGELSSGSGPNLTVLLDLLQTPEAQRVEGILAMKEFNIRAWKSAPDFATLVVDNLLKFQ